MTLPKTFHHSGQIHGVGDGVWLPIVKGLQFLCTTKYKFCTAQYHVMCSKYQKKNT